MYSTLLVLDKPRYLRYTFKSVQGLEQAIPGGFLNLWKYPVTGENGFRVLRDILYAGLQDDDPALTLSELGEILFYFTGGWSTDSGLLVTLWKKVFDTLDYDEWTGGNQQGETVTVQELFEQVEEIAYGTLRIQPSELYALTPREFNLMIQTFGELDNYRTGLLCATIMNSVGGKKGGGAFQVEDFVNVKKNHKVMSDDEIKETLINAFL